VRALLRVYIAFWLAFFLVGFGHILFPTIFR
jgi:hypothetical protein